MRMTEEQYQDFLRKHPKCSPDRVMARVDEMQAKKRSKFLNVKTRDAAGVLHDGKGECQRWQELQLMERAGAIRKLRRQVTYAFVDNGQLITTFRADYVYEDGAATIVEDHKSPRTRKLEAYRHKVKLMQSHYGIQVREVTK